MDTLFITEKAIAHEEFQSAHDIAEKVAELCLIDRQRIDERLVYVRKVVHACDVISSIHCMLDFGVDSGFSAQEYNDAVALVREFLAR